MHMRDASDFLYSLTNNVDLYNEFLIVPNVIPILTINSVKFLFFTRNPPSC